MADRYLLESGSPDGYLLEDGSGVLLLDTLPTITSSATVNNTENTKLSHGLTADQTVTWSIVGGADQADFELSGSTLRWVGDGTKTYSTGVDWTPETPPAGNNEGFGSSTSTFTGINFGVGLGIVRISSYRRPTGVTVGGDACTLVAESDATGPEHASIWKVTIASGGSKTVVVTAAAGHFYVNIDTGTLTGADATETDTSIVAFNTANEPHVASSSLVVPTDGIGLAVAWGGGSSGMTWNTGTEETDFADASASGHHTSAKFLATDTPSYSGTAFAGNAMAAAAWGP